VPVDGFTQAVLIPGAAAMLFVSGVTARLPDGSIAALGDIEGQTRQVLENLRLILAEVDATPNDVVRIGTYLRHMEDHPIVHRVRSEFFGLQPPACTTVEVSRLFDERQLVEIDAIAIVPQP